MLQILGVLAPIFALILLGYVCGLRGWLGSGATDALNRFVLRIALPAELFHLVAGLPLAELNHPGFAISFGAGMVATSLLAFLWDWRRPVERTHRLSGATIEGLSAGYANTAFIGIPICLSVFGAHASAALAISTLEVVCLLFAIAIFLIELDGQQGGSRLAILGRVLRMLMLNPIIFAPVLGLALNVATLPLPGFGTRFVTLLADAATPCALITIGLFLAETRDHAAPRVAVWRVTALKLVLQPALTFAVALTVALPPIWTHEAVLLGALPTGTGPFMLARLYRHEAGVASRVILLSTVLSIATICALLLWIA